MKKGLAHLLVIVLIGSTGYFMGVGQGKAEGMKEYEAKVTGDASQVLAFQKNVDFKLFNDVWNKAKTEFYKQPVMDTKLFYGAVGGIVSALGDPYSEFFDPEMTKEFTDDISGSFEGIGAEIGFRNSILAIMAPLPGSPAEKAGLMAGDYILKIDGVDTSHISLFEAVKKIKGPKGTTVTLEIARENEDESKKVEVTRDTIIVQSVITELRKDGIFYAKITDFREDVGQKMVDALQKVDQSKIKGVILDLRNDPGGYLQSAVEIGSLWVGAGKNIVLEKQSNDEITPFVSQGPGALSKYKTVVLVNVGSASASEIVAGALQDYKLATLVGTTTFGKGSVQNYMQLDNGSSMKITVAEWLTPLKRQINGLGIKPDVEVKLSRTDIDQKKDPQMQKALDLLK